MHNDNSTEKRADFYRRIRQQHLTPLWEALHSLVPAQPAGGCRAALWRCGATASCARSCSRLAT